MNWPVFFRIGTGLHQLAQVLFLLARKLPRATRRLDVDQPVGALLIEAMHPVAQRLAIHAADAGRLLAIHPVANRRQRQQSPRLIGVLRLRGQAAQVHCHSLIGYACSRYLRAIAWQRSGGLCFPGQIPLRQHLAVLDRGLVERVDAEQARGNDRL